MDGMNFGRREQRPDEDENEDVLAGMGRYTAGALAVFAIIVVATLAGIVVLDRLGVPFSVPEFNAGP